MKYSYNWLKELSETSKNPQELKDLLMLHAFEVEGVEETENKLEGVIVGEILELEKHPNADKLQLTKINIGEKEPLQIVCGAHNISVGDKVPVATVGTTLPGNFTIKEAEIRGVKSFGMLCAEDELGLGTSHEGILLLDRQIKVATPISEVLGLDDATIEVDILANRAHDALCHVGMAREIAALEGRGIDYDWDGLKLPKQKSKKLEIKIEDSKLCSRYAGAVLENIQVGPSPQWLKNKLERCGIRSINNVVDATNYVMIEIGQPLHAFDLDKISSMQIQNSNNQFPNKSQNPNSNDQKVQIIVRAAKEGEEITILDGTTKKLSKEDIVIANPQGPIALAGVMGGLDTGVTENTKAIVLESANFSAPAIRRTRMKLGISSDAALRFEKEIDPNIAEKALVRVIEILEHIANGQLEGVKDEYLVKKNVWTIELELNKVTKLLGVAIDAKTCKQILANLEIKIGGGKVLKAQMPTFRLDLKTQEDLIEEIGRVYGYAKIPVEAPLVSLRPAPVNEKRIFARQVKNMLAGLGFYEVYNYSFYSKLDASLAQLGSIKHLELETPMNPEQELMRVSLIPGLLKNIRENLKNFKEFSIFEYGRVYWSNGGVLPEEKNMLVGAIVLEKKSAKQQAQDKRHQSAYFEGKAVVDHLLEQLGIVDQYYDEFDGMPIETPLSLWHQSRSAEIKIEGTGQSLGYVGEINPFVLSEFDIHTRVVMFEFEMDKLFAVSEDEREFLPIRKHPVVVRDISMLAQKSVRIDDVLEAIQEAGGDLILEVDMFDAIDFADNTSSFAFHIVLGAEDRTLTGKEADDVLEKITKTLPQKVAVTLRQ